MKKFFLAVIMCVLSSSLFAKTNLAFSESAFETATPVQFEKLSYESSSSDDEPIAWVLCKIVFYVLFLENMVVFYDDYPFKNGDYISYAVDTDDYIRRSCRFAADANACYFPRTRVFENDLRFEGTIFHIIGPLIEHTITKTPDSDSLYSNLKLGGIYNIFQTNPLSCSFFMQWSHLYGGWKNNGIRWGFILKSYIARKLLLEYRIAFSDYDFDHEYEDYDGYDPDSIVETHLEAGLMLSGPYELYAAWKWVQNGFTQTAENGVCVGMKCHF
ncbi:MAG: hypothetical protein J5780_04090 [Treponema sp.]|nr:hypothetical protein [Treponema sp.]